MNFYLYLITLATLYNSKVLADCNPLTSRNCPANLALASSFREDFLQESQYFTTIRGKGISYSQDGISLTIKDRFDNPTIKSNFYIMFGKIEVVMQAAKGKGVISTFYLQSDTLDEIDVELFGGNKYEYQSNFFSKGDTSTYDRGGYHETTSDPTNEFHTYTIDWTKDSLTWSVDGVVNRVLRPDNGQGFPENPSNIMIGIWAGGDTSNHPGTVEWAGGETDFSKAPFTMHVKSLIVTDYSTGKEYSYRGRSGSWRSIVAKDGRVNGRYNQARADFRKLRRLSRDTA